MLGTMPKKQESPATAKPGDRIHGQGLMDGANTLIQAAESLEAHARYLRSLDAQGWSVTSDGIRGDRGILVDPSGDMGWRAEDFKELADQMAAEFADPD